MRTCQPSGMRWSCEARLSLAGDREMAASGDENNGDRGDLLQGDGDGGAGLRLPGAASSTSRPQEGSF